MDFSKLTARELNALLNALIHIDVVLMDENLPEGFADFVAEYLALDEQGRASAQDDIAHLAAFKGYADTVGNPDMTDALMKVADDLKDMSAKQLVAVKTGGIAGLSKLSLAK